MTDNESACIILSSVHTETEGVSFSDYAVIALSNEKLDEIFELRKHAKTLERADINFYQVHFWDYSVEWIANSLGVEHSSEEDLEKLEDLITAEGFIVLTESEIPEALVTMSSECNMLVITPDCFYWQCVAKHCDVRQTTQSFEFKDFEKYLKNERAE